MEKGSFAEWPIVSFDEIEDGEMYKFSDIRKISQDGKRRKQRHYYP
jgi:hypothetical protein